MNREALASLAPIHHEPNPYGRRRGTSSYTGQSGEARMATALTILLADQSAHAATAGAGLDPASPRWPFGWFAATSPSGLGGYPDPTPLWGGVAPRRPGLGGR